MGAFTGAKSASEGTGICCRPDGWYHRKNQKRYTVGADENSEETDAAGS